MGDSWLETNGMVTAVNQTNQTRIERDPLGEMPVPVEALWGIQTERARQNFPISNLRPLPAFVDAVILIKKAAALTHRETGRLDAKLADAIVRAADEVLAGGHREQFVVDPYQAGAGTSHNMNCNEVLANRANELLGAKRGEYKPVHPNDHVNMAQSTNDVIPTAIRIGALSQLTALTEALTRLARAFAVKGKAFDGIVKSGRTHLQDATPIRLGQEFAAYADTVERNRDRIVRTADDLRDLGIGGTAVGTGLNAEPQYPALMIKHLRAMTRLELREGKNRVQLMQSMGDPTAFSGAVRTYAADLGRIASDLRLLASGPRTGLAEIVLPAVQPGSSIMPGKVNPSIPEMVNQVCFQVIGNDVTSTRLTAAGGPAVTFSSRAKTKRTPVDRAPLARSILTWMAGPGDDWTGERACPPLERCCICARMLRSRCSSSGCCLIASSMARAAPSLSDCCVRKYASATQASVSFGSVVVAAASNFCASSFCPMVIRTIA